MAEDLQGATRQTLRSRSGEARAEVGVGRPGGPFGERGVGVHGREMRSILAPVAIHATNSATDSAPPGAAIVAPTSRPRGSPIRVTKPYGRPSVIARSSSA